MSHRRRLTSPFTGVAGPIHRRARKAALTLLVGGTALVGSPTAQAGPLQGTSVFGWADDPATEHAASVVGDVNGDGFDDLAFGEGTTLRIVAGSRTGVNVDDVATATGAGVFRLDLPEPIAAVDAAGDFDGDGIDDLVVIFRKTAYVYYGANGVLQGSGPLVGSGRVSAITATPSVVDEFLQPMAAAGIGDFNGDGRGDIALVRPEKHISIVYGGARVATIDAKTKSARVSLVNAHIECQIFLWFLVCRANSDAMVSAIGDVNGDGRDDVAIDGAVSATAAKRYVLFGRAGSFTTEIKAPSNAMQLPRPAGVSYANPMMPMQVGDLDGDGRDELHAKDWGPPGNPNGTRYVLGTATPPASLDVATAPAIELVGGFGAREVGDADGDGRRDLAYLAPLSWSTNPAARKGGELRFVTAPSGPASIGASSGTAVKGLPSVELLGSRPIDFDGDGLTDVVVNTTDALRNTESEARKQLFFVATRGADVVPPQLGPVAIATPRFIGAQGANLFVSADETDTTVEIVYNRQVGGGFTPVATERRAVQQGVTTLRIKDVVGGVTLPVGDYRADVRPIDPAGNRGAVRSVDFTLYVDGPEVPTDLPAGLADLKLSGDATRSGTSIMLIRGDQGAIGTAVFPVKRDYNGRTFEFDVDIYGAPPGGGAQGLAMGFISAEPDGSGNWLGRGGDQLGIGGLGGFAFAWDVAKGPNDPSDNFIGWSPGTLGQGMQWVHTNGSGIQPAADFPVMEGKFKVTFLNKRLRVYVDGVLRMDRAALVPLKSRLAFTSASATSNGGIVELKNLKVS